MEGRLAGELGGGGAQRPGDAGLSFWPESEAFRRKLGPEEGDADAAGAQGVTAGRRGQARGKEPLGQSGQKPEPAGEGGDEAGDTYWGPSARRRGGCPPAGEGRGSPGRTGGPGSSRTGQWSRPWLPGAPLVHSPYLPTPCPPPPHGGHRPAEELQPRRGREANRKLSAHAVPPPRSTARAQDCKAGAVWVT